MKLFYPASHAVLYYLQCIVMKVLAKLRFLVHNTILE